MAHPRTQHYAALAHNDSGRDKRGFYLLHQLGEQLHLPLIMHAQSVFKLANILQIALNVIGDLAEGHFHVSLQMDSLGVGVETPQWQLRMEQRHQRIDIHLPGRLHLYLLNVTQEGLKLECTPEVSNTHPSASS